MAALVGRAAAVAGLIPLLAGLVERELQGKVLLVAHLRASQIMVQAAVVVLLELVEAL
jgi:hypothetical protein